MSKYTSSYDQELELLKKALIADRIKSSFGFLGAPLDEHFLPPASSSLIHDEAIRSYQSQIAILREELSALRATLRETQHEKQMLESSIAHFQRNNESLLTSLKDAENRASVAKEGELRAKAELNAFRESINDTTPNLKPHSCPKCSTVDVTLPSKVDPVHNISTLSSISSPKSQTLPVPYGIPGHFANNYVPLVPRSDLPGDGRVRHEPIWVPVNKTSFSPATSRATGRVDALKQGDHVNKTFLSTVSGGSWNTRSEINSRINSRSREPPSPLISTSSQTDEISVPVIERHRFTNSPA